MTTLNIIQIIGICLLMGCALVYRHKYLGAAAARKLWFEQYEYVSNSLKLSRQRNLEITKELEKTKAELEQYKNHESGT
jgi:hypothetical protein